MPTTPRVLVVDDDQPICELIELALADDGWDVQTRTRGQDALDLLRWWSADVSVLDLLMPDMGAEAFLTAYRKRAQRKVPVLLTSAASDLDEHAEHLDVSEVLSKPFDLDDLCTAVRRLVDRDRAITVASGAPYGGV